MTNKETVERNIGLTMDYVNYLIENPSLTENLPEKFSIKFLEKDFPTIQSIADSKNNYKYIKVKNTFKTA